MTTIWSLPIIEIADLGTIRESRPTALLTGTRAWNAVSPLLRLPLVVQAEPLRVTREYLNPLADDLPPQVEVIYAVGGGMVADCAKYIGYRRNLPVIVIPTILSVDAFFTAIVAERVDDTVDYVTTGPASKVVIDWDVIVGSPRHHRGAAILELLTIVTGILDWQYAANRRRNTPDTRFVPWAAGLMAGIAQQAFKIADGVGSGKIEALRNLLDLICMEVQLTNQLGHNRPQEGSEQFFAYAVESRLGRGRPVPYADMVAPGILLAAALHNQDIAPIRETLMQAGVRLDQIPIPTMLETLKILPEYVQRHRLPYSILNDFNPTDDRINDLLRDTGLDSRR